MTVEPLKSCAHASYSVFSVRSFLILRASSGKTRVKIGITSPPHFVSSKAPNPTSSTLTSTTQLTVAESIASRRFCGATRLFENVPLQHSMRDIRLTRRVNETSRDTIDGSQMLITILFRKAHGDKPVRFKCDSGDQAKANCRWYVQNAVRRLLLILHSCGLGGRRETLGENIGRDSIRP